MLSGPVGRIVNRLTKLSNIFISQKWRILDNGFRKSKKSSPDRYYEQGELPLNEGPQILKHGKDVLLFIPAGNHGWIHINFLICSEGLGRRFVRSEKLD